MLVLEKQRLLNLMRIISQILNFIASQFVVFANEELLANADRRRHLRFISY